MDGSSVTVVIREYDPKMDNACIFTTWRNSAYYGASPPHRGSGSEWFKAKTEEIAKLLWEAKVRIACIEESPDVILGYSVSTGTHLDWVYVKPNYRERGIGTLLVPVNIASYPNETTKIGRAILDGKKNKEN